MDNQTDPATRTAAQWFDIFKRINEDCKVSEPEVVVPINDTPGIVEYYAQQIWIMTEEPEDDAPAYQLALEMGKLAVAENYKP